MELLATPTVRLSLYDKGTTIREIALERIKVKAEPEREDLEDPFIIYDLGDVVAKDNQWREMLPNIDTFFAVKSNPDPVFLRLLLGLGRGFDCSSKNEIKMVLDLGVSPDRIIFAHPCKQESHLRFAREKGVRLMTFDTEEELHKVKRVHPDAKLILRVRFDFLKMPIKFGCRESQVRPLLELAKNMGLSVTGVSFYVGSVNTISPQVFVQAIQHSRPIFKAGRELGLEMDLLDIGGGFPGNLHTEEAFEKLAEAVREALEEHFPPSSGVTVIAEPGSFYTRSAGYLVANVMAKRIDRPNKQDETINSTTGSPVWMYYLNVGVHNAFGLDYVDCFLKRPELLRQEEPGEQQLQLKPSCLWGPTCHPKDVIFDKCMMPEMESGDFVMFHDMGCYVKSRVSEFNGFEIPQTCYIAPREIRPILKQVFSAGKNDVSVCGCRF
ncbi:ornithine decarboxylase-like [Patiria miniata]|uniref:ornithine decarboxylase n=1 Tax=Patiria miniata TaxID=46514 RepID=A0A914APT5_PATMI|nr:ornithine decarboxylase-like [Patiria miniata]